MNRYLFGRVLGEGGFGITYIACDLRLDLKVAIKEYFPTDKATRHAASSLDVTSYTSAVAGNYESSKRKFLAEARTMAKMEKQPEVVGVRDFFETNNTAYIVMEFVDGTTFRDLVKQEGGKIPAQKLLTIIEPLFDALNAVHTSGLVHRDISPDNLMLERGKVRLLDFGCARESTHGTNTLTIALKHGYAPIEQYTNHGQGPWTDIYALAATIYFCITGKAPVRSTDRMLGDELILPSKLGVDLTRGQERALLRAMATQPRRRFQTMEEFHAALYATPDPVVGPTPDPVPPIPEPIPPEPAPIPEPIPPEPAPKPEPVPVPITVLEDNITRPIPALDDPKPIPEPVPDPTPEKQEFWKPILKGVSIFLLVTLLILGFVRACASGGSESKEAGLFSKLSNVVEGKCGGLLTWKLNEDTGRLEILGNGAMPNYENPLNGGENIAPWYKHREKIKTVFVADGVRNIGAWAFAYCYNMTEAELSASVERVGDSGFDHSGLQQIHWEEGLKQIHANAFSGTKLTEVTFPESLEYLGNFAFEHCPNLKKATVSSANTRFAFDTWERPIFSDENGDVPQGFAICGASASVVKEYAMIMGYSFRANQDGDWEAAGECGKDLEWSLDLDSGLLKITGTGDMYHYNGEWQLDAQNESAPDPKRTMMPWNEYRDQIYSVSIGDGVTSIGENAFAWCHNLQDVHWGNTVKTIGFQAFLDTALDQVTLPESVAEIHQFAFNWCRQLKDVELPESMKKLKACVFASCESLRKVVIGSKTEIANSKEFGTPFNHQKGENERERWLPRNLEIHSLQNSPAEEFASKYNLPFVIGIRGLSADYQGQCGNNVWWFIDEGQRTLVLYGTNKPWLFNVPADEQYWPEDSKQIYKTWQKNGELFSTPPAFYYHRAKFDKLIIRPGITWISHNLFEDIPIREADLGTVEEIGLSAFAGTSLEKVTIPESVKLIRGWSFANCEALTNVTILGDARMELCIFHNTRQLRYVTFSKGVKIQDNPKEGDLFNDYNLENQIPRSPQLVFHVVDKSDALRYAKEHGIVYRKYS